ncbi:hypothetical protein N7467_011134 [Penicillium canescens]|nr:hypothetical protein N7467_011134 [Penicillium canescens]
MGDKQGRTALHWSVQNGNEDIVALLLAEGASPNTVNGFQNTNSPQEDLSTRSELPSSEKSLRLEYAWVNSQTIFGDTALHLAAARCNSQKILSLLVEACNVTFGDFETALQIALVRGQEFSAKGILQEMARLNVTGSFESSALKIMERWPNDRNSQNGYILCWAARNGFEKLVTFILNTGKYSFSPPIYIAGRTALQAAAEQDHLEIAKLLLDHGANTNVSPLKHGRTALQVAAEQNHLEMAKLLLSHRADINAFPTNDYGRTAIQAAAEQNHFEMVKLLLSSGAKVNAPAGPTHGRTAIQAAAERNHLDMVKLLLSHGADTNASPRSIYGRTAIQAAAEQNHFEMVELLLSSGADINAPPEHTHGRTAIQAASERNHLEMVKLLLSHGADINALPGAMGGQAALRIAAEQNHLEMAKLLLSHGADINASSYGRTAIEAAEERNHFEMVELLCSYGAETNT